MRPYQRHGGAGWLSRLEPAAGQRWPIPDLLGDEPARAGHARHHLEVGQGIFAAQQLEMRALAGEQRPCATDTGAVEGATVGLLAVAVAVVAVIRNSLRRLDLEKPVRDLERAEDPGIIRFPQAETSQIEVLHADDLGCRQASVRAIGQVKMSAQSALRGGGPDPYVVPATLALLRQRALGDKSPVFHPLVPIVGEREQIVLLLA